MSDALATDSSFFVQPWGPVDLVKHPFADYPVSQRRIAG